MTPLEAAKRFMDWCPYNTFNRCAQCIPNPGLEHMPDCPRLALPQIVAVLEAAQRIVDADDAIERRRQEDRKSSAIIFRYPDPLLDERDAARNALTDAVRGETIPA